jgi:hypothetical protein
MLFPRAVRSADRVIDPEMATVYLDNLDVLARTRRAKGHVAVWASARLRDEW